MKKKNSCFHTLVGDGFACFRSFFHTPKVVLTITGTGGAGGTVVQWCGIDIKWFSTSHDRQSTYNPGCHSENQLPKSLHQLFWFWINLKNSNLKVFFSPNNHWHFFTVLLLNELGEVSSGVGWSSLVWVCVLWMFFTVINVINRRGLCRTESILKLTIAPTPDGAFRESFGVRWVVVKFFPFSGFGSFFFFWTIHIWLKCCSCVLILRWNVISARDIKIQPNKSSFRKPYKYWTINVA